MRGARRSPAKIEDCRGEVGWLPTESEKVRGGINPVSSIQRRAVQDTTPPLICRAFPKTCYMAADQDISSRIHYERQPRAPS